jgi:hypothetical protein
MGEADAAVQVLSGSMRLICLLAVSAAGSALLSAVLSDHLGHLAAGNRE